MSSFLSRLFKRSTASGPEGENEAFAIRFHRFKLFLSAYIEAYSEMMSFEERLADERPLGMPFLRICTTKLTIAAMQCSMQLNALSDGRFGRLDAAFAELREKTSKVLAQGTTPLEGPLVIPFVEAGNHPDIVAPSLAKLKAVALALPEFMPRGFIVTGAAWWRYFNDPAMHDEIDRIMLISREDPQSYAEAGASIFERMASSFPLPEELQEELRKKVDGRFPELAKPGHILLVRCIPVLPEHACLIMPEQLLRTPLTHEGVLKAVLSSFSMAYRTRSLIFRLKRGIRDRAMPLCVSLTLIPEVHARGSVHRRLESPDADRLFVRVRRGFCVPEGWPSQASVEGASLPKNTAALLQEKAYTCLDCLADAPVPGNRHEIFWTLSQDGDFRLLGANGIPDPECLPAQIHEAALHCPESDSLSGGFCAYPGVVDAKVFHVRNFTDALRLPIGSILLLQQASPRWAFLLDFVSGAVCGSGTGNGLFARTARRYGRPSLLRHPEAFDLLKKGEGVRLVSNPDLPPLICRKPDEPCLEIGNGSETDNPPTVSDASLPQLSKKIQDSGQGTMIAGSANPAWPLNFPGPDAPLWLPDSDIAHLARELTPLITFLTLPDSDNIDFRAENCKTFHDVLVYSHVHAVREMFRAGTNRKSSGSPAKQLVCDVPKQFWIINLDDGFTENIQGPTVRLDQIASLPMRCLWEGFTAKPWDGPPPINAKGFLSVLFEASANPNLEPAAQSTQYTEKNSFLIASRFCSMRCRFGFHFLAMDCFLSERDKERFIIFQFKGGAADLQRRIKRVHFVAELLAQFDFTTEITGDTLTARLENGTEEVFLSSLRVLGYLVMHTRQLDMIMDDDHALAVRRFQMLEDMLALHAL